MAATHRWSLPLAAEFGHADINVLGTWQQVVAINLDNRTRDRELVAVLVG